MDWQEVKGAEQVKLKLEYNDITLHTNPDYTQALKNLKELRNNIELMRIAGRLRAESNNPANVSDLMLDVRINVSKLSDLKSDYLDLYNSLLEAVASRREQIYIENIKLGKSASAADKHAANVTASDRNKLDIVKNIISQVTNDVENYNSISMALQSIMKEFNTERIIT